jgi:Thioesterase domain
MSGAGNFVAKSSLRRRRRAGALILAALLLLPAGAQSATRPAARRAASRQAAIHQVASRPHVYLMRGLLNIFSLGMDQLAAQITSRGIDASVYNHTFADFIVDRIVQMYRAGDHGPYILVGHSLGADAVMAMAQELNAQDVPVALVVPVDGTGSSVAPGNVACVINLTQRRYAYMRPGTGFHGVLDNVDFSGDPGIDHLTIDKSPRVQAEALRYVLETAHAEACRPGGSGPIMAEPGETPRETSSETSREKLRETPSAKAAAPKVAAPDKTGSPALRPGLAG